MKVLETDVYSRFLKELMSDVSEKMYFVVSFSSAKSGFWDAALENFKRCK